MVGCDFSRAVPEVVYVLDRDHFGQHGVWIVLGVMRGGDFHPSELLARGVPYSRLVGPVWATG